MAKRGETRSCWTSASASSVGSLVAVARSPASAIASRRSASPPPFDERLGADPDRSDATTVGPSCSAAKRTLKTAIETAASADQPRAAEERADRQAGEGQEGDQGDQDDGRRHAVERSEERDQQHERGRQLGDRVGAGQRGAGIRDDRRQEPHQRAAPS